MKEEEKYQAMVDSMRRNFGFDASTVSLIPGRLRPRNSSVAKLASMGRSRRVDTMKGGNKVEAPVGENQRVQIVRPGTKTSIGSVLFFERRTADLTEKHKTVLRQLAVTIEGKPQKIEVRGHTLRHPISGSEQYRDNWDLAYARSRAVMQYLQDVVKIMPSRFRVSVAEANEPIHVGTDRAKLRQNSRVEVYMLNEVVADLMGTDVEKGQRFVNPDTR
jgi:chemotaxis protein MotB